MPAVKLVVSGPFNAGKSQLIASASEIAPVRTERRVTDHTAAIKATTTAAMDFGRLTLGDGMVLHLYGTPGQRRFDFIWQVLARGMRGLLLVVDSADPTAFAEARQILAFFRQLHPTPVVVAANKQDRQEALRLDALTAVLELPADVPLVPCIATNMDSARAALATLAAHIPQVMEPVRDAGIAPITPQPPARLAIVTWGASREHLTASDGHTLCGRAIPTAALPVFVARTRRCQACARVAACRGLTCTDCGHPLTRSADGIRCLGCAQRRRTTPRDALALIDL
jgi:signal recognition particle receptor subunit beta